MSDETEVKTIRLQLVDNRNATRGWLIEGEVAARALSGALAHAGLSCPGPPPNPDVMVPASKLPAVVGHLRTRLLATLANSTRKRNVEGRDIKVITVLGEPVRIQIRDAADHNLSRLNSLYTALTEAADEQLSIDIFAVPPLDGIDLDILTVINSPVRRMDLAQVLQHRVSDLQRVPRHSESSADLEFRMNMAKNDKIVESHLERLELWKLLHRTRDGRVLATRKLSLVSI